MSIRKPSDGSHGTRDIQRGLQTKNLVKGAAGGARGVDYQDHDAEYLERRDSSAAKNANATTKAGRVQQTEKAASTNAAPEVAQQTQASEDRLDDGPMDVRKVINSDAASADRVREQKVRQEKVEKLKKKVKQKLEEEREPDEESEDEVEEETPFANERVDQMFDGEPLETIGDLLDDPNIEMRVYGALRLRSPEDMRSTLRTPLRIGRHLNVLARRLLEDGAPRNSVVSELADSIVALGSILGKSTLRSFSTAVGIGAVYPLEVLEDIAMRHPHFVPNVGLRPFLIAESELVGDPDEILYVRCDPTWKITAFALKGGGDVGYEFTPSKQPGKFNLIVETPGRWTLMLQGVAPDKSESVQNIAVEIRDVEPLPTEG